MNNYPVKYAILKLVDSQKQLIGYSVCKCFLKSTTVEYFENSKMQTRHTIIIQNKKLDNARIDSPKDFLLDVGLCYSVNDVYNSYKEAFAIANILNEQIFSDYVTNEYMKCNGKNFDCKSELLKHKEKMQICLNATQTLHFDESMQNKKSR